MKTLHDAFTTAINRALSTVSNGSETDNAAVREGSERADALTVWLAKESVSPALRVALLDVLPDTFEGIKASIISRHDMKAHATAAHDKPAVGFATVTTNGPEELEGMLLLAQFINWINDDKRTDTARHSLLNNLIVIAREIERARQKHPHSNPPTGTRTH